MAKEPSPSPSDDSAYYSRHSGEHERKVSVDHQQREHQAALPPTPPTNVRTGDGHTNLQAAGDYGTLHMLQRHVSVDNRYTTPSATPHMNAHGSSLSAQFINATPFPATFARVQNWQSFDQDPANSGSVVHSAKAVLDQMRSFTSKGLQIRVLGVPQQNAKSRVETQIKICLQLVTDKGDKVPLWSHLRLPEYLVPRDKLRKSKAAQADFLAPGSDNAVLSLEASVVCATDPTRTVTTCLGCIQRERKRSRKKEASSKRSVKKESPEGTTRTSDLSAEEVLDEASLVMEQKKVLLFNCSHIVDFSSGDTILPTRITCYCRHHGEKMGFCIYFTARDVTGQIVATGISPPIMITDDHKSNKIKSAVPGAVATNGRKRRRVEEPLTPPEGNLGHDMGANASAVVHHEENPRHSLLSTATCPVALPEASKDHPLSSEAGQQLATVQGNLASPVVENGVFDMEVDAANTRPPRAVLNTLSHFDESLTSLMTQDLGDISPADLAAFDDYLNQPGFFDEPLPQAVPTTLGGPYGGPIPLVSRIIPAEGPLPGGLEITLLGSNFYDGLTVMFGGIPAVTTHFWSPTTLVCVCPPAPVPGPVPVTFREHPVDICSESQDVVMFTYKDDGDRALMELALQVLGLRMTGKLEDARRIAMRIVADPASASSDSNVDSGADGRPLAMDVLLQHAGLQSQLSKSHIEYIILQILCHHTTPTPEPTTRQGHTILHLAILAGMTSLAKWLITTGFSDIDAMDYGGFSAAHLAAWKGMWGVVKVLLESGARFDVRTLQGLLPGSLARLAGHWEVVRLLLFFNPKIESESDFDETELEEMAPAADYIPTAVLEPLPMATQQEPPADKVDMCLDTSDVSNLPARSMGRFSERPRRGKRGRGGRGGSGPAQRHLSASKECSSDVEDAQLLAEILPPATGTAIVEPHRPENVPLESLPPINLKQDSSRDTEKLAKELLYNLINETPTQKDAKTNAPDEAQKVAYSGWYAPLAYVHQLPMLLALPVTMSASALGFGTTSAKAQLVSDPPNANGWSIPLPNYSWSKSPKDTQKSSNGVVPTAVAARHEVPLSDPPPPYAHSADEALTPRSPHTPTSFTHPHHRITAAGSLRPSYPEAGPDNCAADANLPPENINVACNCVSYSGTHETRCARYMASQKQREKMLGVWEIDGNRGSLGVFLASVFLIGTFASL
ncbi:SPT3 Dosage dependent suppressor of Ty-induced promoter mutations-like protein [Gaertneriomyces sp. JEL0708]|nr:SPT3 Dosage dependent suppressor of Ty-induced promoter mutations-like protein [Gaertneriomyces sp. JEL0708]